MDPAWISAGSGLVGALVGASAALGGKWIDARHARKAEQRRQVDELLARFWEVTDRMWNHARDAYSHSLSIQQLPVGTPAFDPEEAPPVSEEDHADWRRQRSEAHWLWGEANAEAGFLLGRMRLLKLSIAEAADTLRSTSALYDGKRESFGARDRALTAYEEAASRLMTR
ncbi:hypothetical protein ACWZJV_05075 [Nocardioides sp. WG-D5]